MRGVLNKFSFLPFKGKDSNSSGCSKENNEEKFGFGKM
jgi:hypothetical protein